MDDIKRKCNPIVDLSKFIYNKKILSEVVDLATIKFLLSNFILFLVSVFFFFLAEFLKDKV